MTILPWASPFPMRTVAVCIMHNTFSISPGSTRPVAWTFLSPSFSGQWIYNNKGAGRWILKERCIYGVAPWGVLGAWHNTAQGVQGMQTTTGIKWHRVQREPNFVSICATWLEQAVLSAVFASPRGQPRRQVLLLGWGKRFEKEKQVSQTSDTDSQADQNADNQNSAGQGSLQVYSFYLL